MNGFRLIGWSVLAILLGLGVGMRWASYRVRSAYDPKVLIHGARGQSEAPAPDQPRPKLVVEQTEYNFGVLDENVTRRHPFVFRNEGQGMLLLTAGTSTCRCTLLELRQTEVPPGGSTEVVIEWNTQNFTGPYRQTATVHTNDPDHPEVVLTISGEVRPTFKITPPDLVFRNVRVGEGVSGEVKIFSYIAQNFQIISHQWETPPNSPNIPPFDVLITPISEEQLKEAPQDSATSSHASGVSPRSGVLVQIRSEPFPTMGSFSQKLLLKTNQPENPQLEIPVEVTVVSDISVFGPGWNEKAGILTFLPIRRGQEAQRKLTIACRGPLTRHVRYQIVSVEPNVLEVKLGNPQLLDNGEASLTPLEVLIPSNTPPMTYLGGDHYPLGRILISTTHPQIPQLEIKVRFAVEP